MFNHYRDIRAISKFQKNLLSAGSWALNGRWRSEAHISKNEATFQIDVIFINKLHIWSLNKYTL